MNDAPSTYESRRVFVHNKATFATFRVAGEPIFAVIPPVTLRRGQYRVELDFETRIASFSLIRLVPTEESP